jgi:hypothetical protein
LIRRWSRGGGSQFLGDPLPLEQAHLVLAGQCSSRRVGAKISTSAVEDPCAIRRRAIAALTAHGLPATVVGDAGYLAGVPDIARTGQGVALLAAVGPAPDG